MGEGRFRIVNKRRLQVLVVIVVAFVAVFVAFVIVLIWPDQREPEYQGRTLSEWLAIHAKPTFPEQKRESFVAVQNVGTNAIPQLLGWLQDGRISTWRFRARAVLGHFPKAVRPNWLDRYCDPYGRFVPLSRHDLAREGFRILGGSA